MQKVAWLIPILPLLGAAFHGLLGRRLGKGDLSQERRPERRRGARKAVKGPRRQGEGKGPSVRSAAFGDHGHAIEANTRRQLGRGVDRFEGGGGGVSGHEDGNGRPRSFEEAVRGTRLGTGLTEPDS